MLTLHIPSQSLSAARRIAYAVEADIVPQLEHYRDEALAQAEADNLTALHRTPFRVYTIILARRVDDVPPVWTVDEVGSLAAAITLFVAVPVVIVALWPVLT